jgi:hypothetical protein
MKIRTMTEHIKDTMLLITIQTLSQLKLFQNTKKDEEKMQRDKKRNLRVFNG